MQITQTQIKTMAKALVKLTKENTPVKHSAVLETISKSLGFKDYNALSPVLKEGTQESDFDKLTKIGVELAENVFWIGLALKENKERPYHDLHDPEEIVTRAKDTDEAIHGIFIETEKLGISDSFADLESVQSKASSVRSNRGVMETEEILEITYFAKGWLAGKSGGMHGFPSYSDIRDIAERHDYPTEKLVRAKKTNA